ncbi:TIGR03085 family metal-binding protein [Plantactinospora sp. GCM10030261]|uniref:TIGR03085 family metal-binding protein n=1 Tax=Plantactinospora sp. GCM10030261 TaxID=3273420 RepID=UPI0036064C07
MSRFARSERHHLADLLLAVGPDAPTLNEGWTARDLAAHLVVRERRPDAAPGILVRAVRGYSERVRRTIAAQPYPELVDQVRRPPFWSPVSNPLTDELANLLEFFIHHEDVRRARDGWQPRHLPAEMQTAIWRRLPSLARLALRRFPGSVLIQAPGIGETSAGRAGDRLRVVGPPSELALLFFGRQRVARVQFDGSPTLAERLRSARLGI